MHVAVSTPVDWGTTPDCSTYPSCSSSVLLLPDLRGVVRGDKVDVPLRAVSFGDARAASSAVVVSPALPDKASGMTRDW